VPRPAERLDDVLPWFILACACFACCSRSFLGGLVKQCIERVLDTPRSQDECVPQATKRLDIRELNCMAVPFSAVVCLRITGDGCQRVKI
jgi:hypothetical protein